jgi:hypothetical protein
MQQKRKPATLQRKPKDEPNKKLIAGLVAGFVVIVALMTVLLIMQNKAL